MPSPTAARLEDVRALPRRRAGRRLAGLGVAGSWFGWWL